jgi:hypothetical protein
MRRKIFFLSAILKVLFIPAVLSQVNLKNTGTLYVTSSTDTLYINGDFTNSSAASLTNNGKLYVKQDLINDQAAMTVGSGTLYLNGSISTGQVVNGTQAFKTFNLVTGNNAGFTLNADLSVSGAHTFTAGMIATSATPNYLIYEAGSSYSGDGDTKHVTGWVKKNGTTDFIFPVGDNTYERTAAISNLSLSSEINCHYYTATQNVFNLASPLVQVKANEYWQIDKVSGGTAQITLNWDNSKVPMDNVIMTDIRAGHFTGGNWTSAGGTASGNILTTGTITSNAVSSFSPFTFGYSAFPVPLKLISFTGERNSRVTYLKWITENEERIDHFEVQRSYDATTFAAIGTTAGRNSGQREQYLFEDNSPLQGLAYYRLRSVDFDGKFTYSRVVVVSDNERNQGSFIVINPARSAITVINKTGLSGAFSYHLFTIGGQQLITGNVQMTVSGGALLPLPAQIAKGVYLLEISNDKIRYSQKILVDR